MLEGIPFGKFYFEAAVILRNSLLVSSMLFNCEAWYNITKAEMELLETVDLMLLRGIFKAPKSTPKEMLFLELELVPFREIVRQRRLGFLFYILNQNEESMIYRVFESQRRNPTKKDWVTTVFSDLESLKWNINLDEIKKMKKINFLKIVKRKIQHKTLMDLNTIKQSHSKVQVIQKYRIWNMKF